MTDMDQATLKDHIEKAQAGDREALGVIYDAYYDRIAGYAFRRVLDVGVAEDVVANVFFTVLNKLPKFQWRHDYSFDGWIFRIASNEVNTYFRNQKRYTFTPPDEFEERFVHELTSDERERIEKEIDRQKQYVALHKATMQLKPKQQDLIQLYFFEHLSHRDIAHALDMREGTVRVNIHRTLKELKKLLAGKPEFQDYFSSVGESS